MIQEKKQSKTSPHKKRPITYGCILETHVYKNSFWMQLVDVNNCLVDSTNILSSPIVTLQKLTEVAQVRIERGSLKIPSTVYGVFHWSCGATNILEKLVAPKISVQFRLLNLHIGTTTVNKYETKQL